MSTLYENIRYYCERAGISGAKLCADSGISKSTLTSLKNGRTKKISTDNLAKMANRLGVSVDELLGSEQKEKSPAPEGDGLTETQQKAWNLIQQMDEESLKKFIVIAKTVKGDL